MATAAGRQSLSSDTLHAIKAQSSTIVSEVYSALIVEFEPKFLALSSELKFLRNQIIFLEERVKNAEQKLDMYDQDLRLDSLLFNGIKQPPSSDLKSVIGGVIRNKMEISEVSDGDILEVRRFKINSSTTRQDAIAPIQIQVERNCPKFFKLKSKLVRTGVFVSENLTKQRRDILNLARENTVINKCGLIKAEFIYALRVMLSPVAYGRCKMSLRFFFSNRNQYSLYCSYFLIISFAVRIRK